MKIEENKMVEKELLEPHILGVATDDKINIWKGTITE